MLKRKPIDTYIRRATAGLPRLERVDTAAEIRIHLLQKTRELMAQGFPREEAEHLAVQEMGPVAVTNRAFLGHMFTSSVGWIVLALTVVSAVTWTYLERHRWIWPETNVREVDFTLKEVAEFQPLENGSRRKIAFHLPKGTRSLEVAFIRPILHHQSRVIGGQEIGAKVAPVTIPDWNRPIDMTAIITRYTMKSNETTYHNSKISFESEQVSPAIGSNSTAWVAYPSKNETPDENDFKSLGVDVYFERPQLQQLELNKWLLLETFFADQKKRTKNLNSVDHTTVGYWGVEGIAIRANDRMPTDIPRTQLRMKKLNSHWKIVETPLAGKRMNPTYDSSIDASFLKKMEQLLKEADKGGMPIKP
jgi:hypothetical protein